MGKMKVTIIENVDEITIYGLWLNSNDNSISKDIKILSKQYYDILGKKDGEILPFYILSKDYNEETKNFKLFTGGLIEHGKLQSITLQTGYYGMMSIKPKLRFLWGLSIGEAKRYFYTKWLPKSNYKGLNFEYEYHTKKSISKTPEIEIYFALDKKY